MVLYTNWLASFQILSLRNSVFNKFVPRMLRFRTVINQLRIGNFEYLMNEERAQIMINQQFLLLSDKKIILWTILRENENSESWIYTSSLIRCSFIKCSTSNQTNQLIDKAIQIIIWWTNRIIHSVGMIGENLNLVTSDRDKLKEEEKYSQLMIDDTNYIR